MTPDTLLFIIKLIADGILAFLAILLMSKTREGSWMAMTAGFILQYAAHVYDLLVNLGVLSHLEFTVFGIPLSSLLTTLLPSLCFIVAFILMICKKQ